jgi:hypothetical protein
MPLGLSQRIVTFTLGRATVSTPLFRGESLAFIAVNNVFIDVDSTVLVSIH